VRAFGGPTHRLALTHALIDNMTYPGLGRRAGDSQTIAVCVCIVGQTRLVVNEIVSQIQKVLAKSLHVFASCSAVISFSACPNLSWKLSVTCALLIAYFPVRLKSYRPESGGELSSGLFKANFFAIAS
jgi:hypothetical protein